jgi:asparagine synthase (glutamine-hydrolysing)
MSSIFALWRRSARIDLDSGGRSLIAALDLYGSDRTFIRKEGQLALGGNLRYFLPEDQFDCQPVFSGHGNAWLVADLRIDNRQELAEKLHLDPTQLATLADSSLLALAWEQWGHQCMHHLVGPFAFAVWSHDRQELFAARDHMGERPLFFHRCADFFALSSMPKGLLALPGVDCSLDEEMMADALVLARYSSARSYFKGIERVPPGHLLRVTPHSTEVVAYWRPFEAPPVRFRRNEEYAEALLEVFDRAVKACLRSTGAIASQLSSGLDSSSVTSSAAVQLARQGQRLTSFTAVPRQDYSGTGAHGRLPDEGPGAAEVARFYPNIDHVLIDSGGRDLLSTVTRLSNAVDEPVQNSVNALWIDAILAATAARGANVLLVAPRGNLTISHAGMEALPQMLRRGHWLRLARTAHLFRQNGLVSFRNSAARAVEGLWPHWLYRRINSTDGFDLSYSPINPTLAAQNRLRDKVLAEFFPNRYSLTLERQQLFQVYEVDTFNAGYRAIHGVDVRDPCADRRVAEFCFSIPSSQYVVDGFPRSLVRRAMKDRLPQSTLTRTRRGQQGADWNLTMRDAMAGLRQQIALNDASPRARHFLDQPRMHALLQHWPEDAAESMQVTQGFSDAVCRGFSFGYFIRQHDPEFYPS